MARPSLWARAAAASGLILMLAVSSSGAPVQGATVGARRLARSAAGLEAESPLKHAEKSLPRAIALSNLEQELEDINVMLKFDRKVERVLLAMPLTEQFAPPVGHYAYGHLHTGDKASIPPSIVRELFRQHLEVPFLFEISRLERKEDGTFAPVDWPEVKTQSLPGEKEMPPLARAYCSILDYRSPEQYLFLPDWLMKALRLKPRDVVRFRLTKLPLGGMVTFQPHTSAFTKLSNHQAVLEMELKYYSCVTRGTTISFVYRKQEYKFNVVGCVDSEGKPQESICVQDTDVATDFLPALDTPAGRRMAERFQLAERQEANEEEDAEGHDRIAEDAGEPDALGVDGAGEEKEL